MYNIAVIGCGAMGLTHLADIFTKDCVNVYGVCDTNTEKARIAAQRFNIKHYHTDYRTFTECPLVDIVIIATYPSSHLEILKNCIANKKHVICEKPITSDLKTGEEFVRLVKANPSCKVLVGHILRHNKTYQYVAGLIQNDTIGKPIVMRMVQNHRSTNWNKELTLIEETSPLIDCGVHYLDVMQWFTGEKIVNVQGTGATTERDVPLDKYNYSIMTVVLSGGSTGFYEVGWGRSFEDNNSKEFIGPKGRIKIIYQKDRSTHSENGNLVEIYRTNDGMKEMVDIPFRQKPTGEQLSHLIHMIEEDVPANPTIDEVFASFKIACDAHSNIQHRR